MILLLGMIAVAGLMIDSGLAWGDRRQAQTAADMGALAAVKAKADGTNITTAAVAMAAANGFPGGGVSCGGSSASGVVVSNPPGGGWTPPPTLDSDLNHYIRVTVTRRMQTTFSGALGIPCWLVSATAIARYAEETTGAPGTPYPAILAVDSCNTGAVNIQGNNLNVTGSVVSNSGIGDPGNGTKVSGGMHFVAAPTGCGPYPPPVPTNGDSYSSTPETTLTSYPITYTFSGSTVTNTTTGASTTCTSFTGGNLTLSNAAPTPGVYCATGNIILSANAMTANITLVAGGRIDQTGSGPYTLTAFWDNLLAFSTAADSGGNFPIMFKNGLTFGSPPPGAPNLIFAPNGTVWVTGNALQTSYGAMWGRKVLVRGNDWALDSSNMGSSGTVVSTFRAGSLVH